jgi:hypothetical protein
MPIRETPVAQPQHAYDRAVTAARLYHLWPRDIAARVG